jgi:general secretion pathway protein M
MMLAISKPLRRVLAITILVVLVFALFSGVVAPVLEGYRSNRHSIELMQAALARSQVFPSDLPSLRAELAGLRQQATSPQGGFLQGPNESMIAAQLQNRVKRVVETARGELKSTQNLPSREEGRFRRIAIRGQMTVSIPALQRTLYDLESTSPLLFIDNVDIRIRPAPRQRDRSTPDTLLDVRFEVYGYQRSVP